MDEQGRPSFSALLNSLRRAQGLYFYAFDLLAYTGKDLRKLRLIERRAVLEEHALADMRDPVRLSAVFTASPEQLIAAAKKTVRKG